MTELRSAHDGPAGRWPGPTPDAGPDAARLATLVAALVAALAPSLLAYNPAPSPTFLNQALALAGWGLWLGCHRHADAAAGWRAAWALLAALATVALAALLAWWPGQLPSSLALSALGLLAAASALALAGAAAAGGAQGRELAHAFAWAWVAAAAASAVLALVQVFAPALADGSWIARSGTPGRAVGNLRQPNHLSSLLVWGCIGLVALHASGRLARGALWGLGALLVSAVVLTASRTGGLSVIVLAAWGALDRRLDRASRGWLLATPVLYLLAWAALAAWSHASGASFHAEARLGEQDLSSSRLGIWANTLALIAAHPWGGVGFGEFNAAWSLSAFPGRPTAFFDHAHNLPLQLLAELGLPLGGAVLALLLFALWQGWRRSAAGVHARCAWMMVLMIGLHSLLEYPLWYAYFLLPAAWAWGHALGSGAAPRPSAPKAAARRPGWPARLAAALVLAALLAVADYWRVVMIFAPAQAAGPLAARIDEGRRSLLFAHHADYAAATTGLAAADDLAVYGGALHYLLDTRLMTAWALSLEAAGRHDEAATVAERLREFAHPGSAALFAGCDAPATAAHAFACRPPRQPTPWRALLDTARGP